MKLKKLFKDIPFQVFKGSKEVEVTGVCSNSRLVSPGNLFIARKGRTDDGNRYILEAVSAGAAAVVTDIYDPTLKGIVQIIHPDVSSIEGSIAANYYQFPSSELFLVGITGTNGKTTTAFQVKHVLEHLGMPCGLMGTIEHIIGSHRYKASRTTPDVATNHKLLREMVLQGLKGGVMEVTSHALDQGRVDFIEYDVAIFTNLSLDHLDYHQTMENYCIAKKKLFESFSIDKSKKKFAKTAVVNVDNPWHKQIVEGCFANVITYGITNHADVLATDVHLTPECTHMRIKYLGQSIPCQIPLVGRFNVYNCLAAIAVGLSQGHSLEKLVEIMKTFPYVVGRMERVSNALGLKIYVDFAHSDDALCNVLECLKEVNKGRIITVFGCGGERDQTKRAKMGAVAEKMSDFTIVTSDNPRSEDPAAICKQIQQGFTHAHSHIVEIDRRAAILKAIEMAQPDDLILIAGKGHETQQIFAHKTVEFDDCKVAAQLCESLVSSK